MSFRKINSFYNDLVLQKQIPALSMYMCLVLLVGANDTKME